MKDRSTSAPAGPGRRTTSSSSAAATTASPPPPTSPRRGLSVIVLERLRRRRRRGRQRAGVRGRRRPAVPLLLPRQPAAAADHRRPRPRHPAGAPPLLLLHARARRRRRRRPADRQHATPRRPPHRSRASAPADDAARFDSFYAATGELARALWPTVTEPLLTRSEAQGAGRRRRAVGCAHRAPDRRVHRVARSQNDLVRGVVADGRADRHLRQRRRPRARARTAASCTT